MRHVVIMSLSASFGLVSIFLADFADLYFISLLGKKEMAAAVGFAGTLIFFNMSIMIGLMIAMSALASQRIGRGEGDEARRIATSVAVNAVMIGIASGSVFWLCAPDFMEFLGASGETRDLAVRYLRIILPTAPISALAMVCSGLLRAHGDARRAMNATLAVGIVNAILDPIFIFGFSMGLEGAAYALVAARFAMLFFAVYPVIKYYGGFAPFDAAHFRKDFRPIYAIAGPAILTNIATPIGLAVVTRAIAPYGDAAVAGYAVIGRLSPLAFCVIFALSGAVGPIIGQNFGARDYGRVRETLTKAMLFTGVYTLFMWAVLFLMNGFIADQFGLMDSGRNLVFWFALIVAPLFFFNGVLFVSNAAFNNLNRPLWSTLLNWGRNTIGIAPFVWLGAEWAGAPGVIIGQGLGGVFFAGLGVWLGFRLIDDYENGRQDPKKGWKIKLMRDRPAPPFSTS
ncbi:MAG: MATE family efflux transporter [Hyphococcus sp.]|nr:MAG: MATE family efflux transporter [Marinicaulis sp.]